MRCEAHDSHADDERDSSVGGFSEFDEDVSFEDSYDDDDEESDDDEDADDEDEADEEEEGDEDLAYFLGEDEDENY